MEYLLNYGVVVFIVLLLFLFIWQYDLLVPPVARGYTGFLGLVPHDWAASSADERVYVSFINDLDEPVVVDYVNGSLDPIVCEQIEPGFYLDPGDSYVAFLNCSLSSGGYGVGDYYRVDIVVGYTSDSGLEHTSFGEVHGPVEGKATI